MTQKQSQTFHANEAAQKAFIARTTEHLRTMEELGGKWFTEMSKVATFQAKVVQSVLIGVQAHVMAVAGIKAPLDMTEVQRATLKPLFEQAVEHSKEAHAIAMTGAHEIGKAIEAKILEVQKNTGDAIHQACEQAPDALKPLAQAVQTALETAQDATETTQKQMKRVSKIIADKMRAAGIIKAQAEKAARA